MGASLPPKEANLFKLIVKSYETKQYKKGLKAADAILKKFPDHGDDRSLIFVLVQNDLKSHVCWHVFGLLYRSDREYREAIKCYRNALRIDPDNLEILRDLSLLQISLLEECGFLERALEELHKKELEIVDKLEYKEQEVSLLVKLGRFEEGEKLYRSLLSMNPDNYRYYEGLQKCVGLYSENGHFSPDEIDRLDALYKALREQFKWSSAVKRIPLDFLQDDRFKEAADSYIRTFLTKADILERLILELENSIRTTGQYPGRYYEGLQKCVGLYSENGHFSPDEIDRLDALYKALREQFKWSSAVKRIPLDFLQDDRFKEAADSYIRTFLTKADILERLILELENSIRTTGQYPGRVEKEPPSTLMWTLFLLAQSRILKHAGDLAAAAALADEARCMDLADRYVNSECVKRMLQADQVDLAEKTAVLFTKEGDQHTNLHDMQCMWYELASAESYYRQGDLGLALKKFLAVEKHYADISEDQFDFHSYCLRKMTLRTYVEMLKFQDRLHSHTYFRKAAAGAIRCYIKLHDSPPKSTTEEDDEASKLLPSQKRKLRQKQRKAEARAKKEAEEKNEEFSASGPSKSGKRLAKPVDPDPRGETLLQVKDPLSEATKYLKLLQKHSPDSLETHLLSFELYMRKQKVLLAFQAVKQLLRLDAEHPDSHRCLIKFFHKVGSINAPVTDTEKLIWGVLEAEHSLTHRAAFGEMLYILDPNRRSEAVQLIEGSRNNVVQRNGAPGQISEWKLKDCIAVHKLLGTVLVDQDAALRWKVCCAEIFSYSTYFEGSNSSASPNSVLNQICKSTENGSANHLVVDHKEESVISNGKLEAFKDLTISQN
ncbi:hypothetical protein TanjilG_16312 [Lupinus angustifolius]|uniref:Uncharacterized protein n=1 Tax=Lupinus angustifolius TaxID=3871 RepID=A0A1J7I4W6_LUPAN|nr:hypothetical protein TanjilG_16312 [Lupinus angustifolius]